MDIEKLDIDPLPADQSAFPWSTMTQPGLTKLEYFAGVALQGFLACPESCQGGPKAHAEAAVRFAQGLLARLEEVGHYDAHK